MPYVKKEDILNNISILEIVEEFNLKSEDVNTGAFDKKCICPSKDHKHGKERTGSLFINSKGNDFFCFGCNASGNVIDFYMLCKDISFKDAFSELSKRVDEDKISSIDKPIIVPGDNFPIKMKISKLFYMTLKEHPEDFDWLNSVMKQTDLYLENIDSKDEDKTKKLFSKLEYNIIMRYK